MATVTVFSDLNVRLPQVGSLDTITITDSRAVVQSLWRLFSTVEGEIPYYRSYGLNLKQFIQKPLTKGTAADIYDHVKQKVLTFEQRVDVVQADADVDKDNGIIFLSLTVRVKSTSEIIQLEPLQVPIGV